MKEGFRCSAENKHHRKHIVCLPDLEGPGGELRTHSLQGSVTRARPGDTETTTFEGGAFCGFTILG